MEKFTFFWSGPFSQWHPSPFTLEGNHYTCAEQYMMAEKARLFGDAQAVGRIMSTAEPSDHQRWGREVTGFIQALWDDKAQDIVYWGNFAKFTQNPDLWNRLKATAGTTMVEASKTDIIWGIGLGAKDPRAKDRRKWRGTNWLGQVLTKVRDDLLADPSFDRNG